MKFHMATRKHGFVELEAEPFYYNGIECFIHQNEDNTYNVSSAHLGYALITSYYNKNEALAEIKNVIDKHKDKILMRINDARDKGYLTPNYQ